MPSCSQPSRTLRAAEAVARRRAIPDRRCARRRIARAGRDGRMVPIEQKDCAEEDRASILGQNHPLDSTKNALWFRSQAPRRLALFVFAVALLKSAEVTHQAWDDWSADVPMPAFSSWTRAGSLRLPGDPSHAFALLQDPGRADKSTPLADLPVLPPVPTNRRPQRE